MEKRDTGHFSVFRLVPARYWKILAGLIIFSLLVPILANDIPLYVHKEGRHHFPVLSVVAPALFPNDQGIHWQDREHWGDQYVLPPIPYHAKTLDLANAPFVDPFDAQQVPHWRHRHWLGTDDLGRDVLAGMIYGTRISLFVGLFASLVAVLIGMMIGGVAGYVGDTRYRPTLARIALFLILAVLGIACAIAWYQADVLRWWMLPVLGAVLWIVLKLGEKGLSWLPFFTRKKPVPVDLITLRLIETMRSIPDLFLIIGLAAVLRSPGLVTLVVLIALIRWPVIARYVRAEMLRVRGQDYIMYARGTGLPEKRIFWGHALPNALTPVWVLGAFTVAIAILLESSLSFLGIGIPADWVTWGSMLNLSRRSLDAWHMALFPGLAMFLTIFFFNRIGEVMESRLREIDRSTEI
jgi:peptide/nickel transport system permease protein